MPKGRPRKSRNTSQPANSDEDELEHGHVSRPDTVSHGATSRTTAPTTTIKTQTTRTARRASRDSSAGVAKPVARRPGAKRLPGAVVAAAARLASGGGRGGRFRCPLGRQHHRNGKTIAILEACSTYWISSEEGPSPSCSGCRSARDRRRTFLSSRSWRAQLLQRASPCGWQKERRYPRHRPMTWQWITRRAHQAVVAEVEG